MRVLVIAAHPDDTEFISGGTIASMVSRGDVVTYLVVTSGELGLLPDPSNPYSREEEQLAAAAFLRVESVKFLREPDGYVTDGSSLRCNLVRAIRENQPQLVITHSPIHNLSSVRYSHPDHLAVGRASIAAVFPEARNRNWYVEQFSEGLNPWTVPEVWLCGVEHSNFAVDISEYFDRKVQAAGKHVSQKQHFADFTDFFSTWAKEVAERHRLGPGVLAEEFHRITTA
jgi:LmbE family N-acetylglucosaminyl deacetylase